MPKYQELDKHILGIIMTLVHDGPLLRFPSLNNPDYDDDDAPPLPSPPTTTSAVIALHVSHRILSLLSHDEFMAAEKSADDGRGRL